ncbi:MULTISPECIES: immunoglobulin-like domain-containing protein [Oscillospiraceae]|uniref:immunoglobulin-like domain-containing protein n=1 Tax=Oscillospiraceae TaxID=216572 RepID=UPI0011059B4D|nr:MULTISPECIES: immunoglobulin-like domain-containing protein [Oscillospiraceae]
MKILILLVVILLSCNGCASKKELIDNNKTNSPVLLELCSDKKIIPSSSSQIEVKMINKGERDIVTGEAYSIEIFLNKKWTEVPVSISYEDIAYTIEAGEEKNFICMLEGISEKGLYRIKKPYSIDTEKAYSLTEYAYAEFQISANKEEGE